MKWFWTEFWPSRVLYAKPPAIPAGILTDDAILQAPPLPISTLAILHPNLPEAWGGETTTALAISLGLSKQVGKTLPWTIVRDAIDGAFRAGTDCRLGTVTL